jgi:hypothetical protein
MPTRTRKPSPELVAAREAIVINVGARPLRYGTVTVRDRRTGEMVTIPDTNHDPIDPGDEGVPYAFKALQKVAADHPAVKACPGAFITVGGSQPTERRMRSHRR